jgi:hypothetical protein
MDQPFRKGRNAVNMIEGGSAQYLQQNQPYQMAQEVERIERYLRASTGYSKQADGETPANMAATGAGLSALDSGVNRRVGRYHRIIAEALVDLDSLRLQWDEALYAGHVKTLDDTVKGAASDTYDPARHIDGHYGTRRLYGLMAGWDEPQKLVGGLQLTSSGAIDMTTFRENLSGIDNVAEVETRLAKEAGREGLKMALMQAAEMGDPRAIEAFFMLEKNGEWSKAFDAFYKEPEAAPEPQLPEQPPDLATLAGMMGSPDQNGQMLARLTGGGNVEGGVQTVSPMGP